MASKIARHYHLAGQEAFAAEQYLVAGEYARSLFANREALDHFQLALALGVENAAQAHEHIGDLQTLGGEYGAAITSYEAAAALSDAPSAGHIEHKLGNVYHRQGDWGLAASHYEAAGESVESTSFLARVRSDQSLNAHRSGHIDQAVTLAQEALKLAQESDDLGALAQAHNILGVLSKGQGDLDGAVRHLQESLRIAESSGGPEARVAALNNLALSYGANTQHQRAIELANEALKLCETWGDRHRLAAIHNNLADLHHSISDTDEAMRHLTEAASIFADIGSDADEMQPEIWKLVEW
jgi:tetratricopeptide (TPR) repeat protein